LGMNMILVGMALVPISHMTDNTPSIAQAEPQVWQTELSLADTQPALLIESDGVVIEKVTSRYQEVVEAQARAHAEKLAQAEKQRIEAQKQIAAVSTVTVSSGPCNTIVSEEEKWHWINQAAGAYNIPAKLLGAVWQIETGKRFCTSVSSFAGAQGPLQFMPGTWRKYAKDGNGDGASNINDARDALFAAAHLLASNGADRGNYRRALFAYNHADWYVNKVLAMAQI
jgi:membrane-bound lytic murein transglycosylase B